MRNKYISFLPGLQPVWSFLVLCLSVGFLWVCWLLPIVYIRLIAESNQS